MPHIIIMHSLGDNLDQSNLMQQLHDDFCSNETVAHKTVKTFALNISDQIIGDNTTPNDMIHIIVRMKPGRTQDSKVAISQSFHDITRNHMRTKNIKTTVSVDIHELDEITYVSSHS